MTFCPGHGALRKCRGTSVLLILPAIYSTAESTSDVPARWLSADSSLLWTSTARGLNPCQCPAMSLAIQATSGPSSALVTSSRPAS